MSFTKKQSFEMKLHFTFIFNGWHIIIIILDAHQTRVSSDTWHMLRNQKNPVFHILNESFYNLLSELLLKKLRTNYVLIGLFHYWCHITGLLLFTEFPNFYKLISTHFSNTSFWFSYWKVLWRDYTYRDII